VRLAGLADEPIEAPRLARLFGDHPEKRREPGKALRLGQDWVRRVRRAVR